MTTSAPEASANSDNEGAPTATVLDGLFPSPSKEHWVESALAGLGADATLASIAHETLDGIKFSVLYDSAPPQMALGALHDRHVSGWDNRVAMGLQPDADKANRHILEALAGGNTSVEIDASNDTDFARVLNGVMLDVAHVSLRPANEYSTVSQAFKRHVDTQDIDPAKVLCSFNADPVGHWLRTGDAQHDIEAPLDVLGQFARETSDTFTSSTTVLVDVTLHHNAGASAVQELHAALATATLYLDCLVNSGMTLQAAARQIVFQMSCDADVLMGVIKLRSLARLWQHVLRQHDQTTKASQTHDLPPLTLVVETSKRHLSRLEPWNNHLRNMSACTAAAMGNATSIIVHPHDQIDGWNASADPGVGVRMARNLPIILEREAGLTRVADPLAGSHAIETLTTELIDKTWLSLSQMNSAAGWLQSIQSGQWQQAVARVHALRVSKLGADQLVMVGVNRYATSNTMDNSKVTSQVNVDNANELKLAPVRDSAAFETATAHASSSDDTSNS